ASAARERTAGCEALSPSADASLWHPAANLLPLPRPAQGREARNIKGGSMRRHATGGRCAALGLAALAWLLAGTAAARAQQGLIGKINLATTKGVEAVKGEWRYHDVTTGVWPKQNEIEPRAHGKFDDSKWQMLKPETLGQGRGAGKYCWCWYRIRVTIPDTVN